MGYRVILSSQGQQRVLEELHAGHPGVAQIKGLARTIVWWPGLDVDIKCKVQSCSSCQETRNAPPKLHCIPRLDPISRE